MTHGRLVIRLRRAVDALTVSIGRHRLTETAAPRRRAHAGRLKRLPLAVAVRDASGRTTTLHVAITRLR